MCINIRFCLCIGPLSNQTLFLHELTTDGMHVHFNFLPIVLYLFSIDEVIYMEKHLRISLHEFIGLTLLIPKHLSTELFLFFI